MIVYKFKILRKMFFTQRIFLTLRVNPWKNIYIGL